MRVVFIKFSVKRALKQAQTLHMEGKLQFIRYFSRECILLGTYTEKKIQLQGTKSSPHLNALPPHKIIE